MTREEWNATDAELETVAQHANDHTEANLRPHDVAAVLVALVALGWRVERPCPECRAEGEPGVPPVPAELHACRVAYWRERAGRAERDLARVAGSLPRTQVAGDLIHALGAACEEAAERVRRDRADGSPYPTDTMATEIAAELVALGWDLRPPPANLGPLVDVGLDRPDRCRACGSLLRVGDERGLCGGCREVVP